MTNSADPEKSTDLDLHCLQRHSVYFHICMKTLLNSIVLLNPDMHHIRVQQYYRVKKGLHAYMKVNRMSNK